MNKITNKERASEYRRKREKEGWKYFSIFVPKECYFELKKFYLQWKINNLDKLKGDE